MKKSFSIAIILLIWQSAWSQEIASNKSVIFENPLSREKNKIEEGNRVTIRYKILDARVTGVILHLTDSSLILGVNGEQSFISFRDIADLKIIQAIPGRKRGFVKITLKNGGVVSGWFARTSSDSMSLWAGNRFRR